MAVIRASFQYATSLRAKLTCLVSSFVLAGSMMYVYNADSWSVSGRGRPSCWGRHRSPSRSHARALCAQQHLRAKIARDDALRQQAGLPPLTEEEKRPIRIISGIFETDK